MNIKNSSNVKSVRFKGISRFRFCGLTLELPADHELIELQMHHKRFVAVTDQGEIKLKCCAKCKRLLQLTEFYKDVQFCKSCHSSLTFRWKKNHPELAKKYAEKYSKKYRYRKKLIDAGIE